MRLGKIQRLEFARPSRNRIAILYSDDYWLRRLVIRDLPATTLGIYPEVLYLNWFLLLRFLRRLRFLKLSGSRGPLRNLLWHAQLQYALTCLDQIGAQVVLTYIDNSGLFQALSRIDTSGRVYFAVQNGTRTVFCVRDSLAFTSTPVISMTNFFCFGQHDIDLYRRHGHFIDRYLPVGSLVGGFYGAVEAHPRSEFEFDLCLVSQWHAHHFSSNPELEASRRVGAGVLALNGFLRRLLDETPLSLVVCLRNNSDPGEESFFRAQFAGRAQLVNRDVQGFSTYRIADKSRLTIALNSTTLADLFGFGKKVLWSNVTADEHYEMRAAGISYFEGDDYAGFKKRVLNLLEMSVDDYVVITRENARYINNCDATRPPHELIRAELIAALNAQGANLDVQ